MLSVLIPSCLETGEVTLSSAIIREGENKLEGRREGFGSLFPVKEKKVCILKSIFFQYQLPKEADAECDVETLYARVSHHTKYQLLS